MANRLAIFVTYSSLLAGGNPITNKLSIGGKTPLTGPDPPGGAAIIGGLSAHGLIEGKHIFHLSKSAGIIDLSR
jgi:hypothetical protein